MSGPRVLVAAAIIVAATACNAGADGDSPSAPAAALRTATEEPTAEPTPTAEPAPTPDPVVTFLEQCADAPEPQTEPIILTLGSSSDGFDTDRLEGPRHCEPFRITLSNTRGSAEHMVAIEPMGQIGVQIFKGDFVGKAETITYEIPPLPAGEYLFVCNPHRQFMQGTLVVSPGG